MLFCYCVSVSHPQGPEAGELHAGHLRLHQARGPRPRQAPQGSLNRPLNTLQILSQQSHDETWCISDHFWCCFIYAFPYVITYPTSPCTPVEQARRRTYSLCGTAEYVPPEVILQVGALPRWVGRGDALSPDGPRSGGRPLVPGHPHI